MAHHPRRGDDAIIDEPLEGLRRLGWSVAVHNDYTVNGARMTFWLFTHPCGLWVNGEGATDEEAMLDCMKMIQDRLDGHEVPE